MRGLTLDQLWAFLAVALPALAALLVPMPAVDLAYQLRAGADVLNGSIPATEAWTFTAQGATWLDQQWAAQSILAATYQGAGWTGLALLRAALVALAFGMLFAALRSRGLRPRPAAIATLVAFAVAAPALALRPQLFGVVLFAATVLVLALRESHARAVWLIPPIAVAWANVHGTFPLSIVLVGLALVDDVARRAERQKLLELAAVGGISVAATLVNPFGLDVWTYVANLARNQTIATQVSEWRAPSPLDPIGALFFGSVVAAGVIIVLALRRRAFGRSDLAPFLTLLAFGALGASSGRGLAWWALAAPVAVATVWAPRAISASPTPRARERERRSPLNAGVVGLLVVAGVGLLPAWRPTGPAGVPAATLTHAPQGIAAFLVAQPASRVWNPQTWGSWLEFAAPQHRYATDSRIELFPPDVWPDAAAVESGDPGALAILDRRRVEQVVARADQVALAQLLDGSSAWTRVYADADGVIWALAPRS